ncbi:MAG: hypothetical protein JST40_13860 [Armatimonadetes bacterium]|nr:hypothetical protein [Armatimonadota bacterium]
MQSEYGKFVGYTVLMSVGYGIAHDLVTAHLWVPYFTVHHPKLVESQNPIIMALLWGVIATWWVGGLAGLVLAVISLFGKTDPVPFPVFAKTLRNATIILFVLAMCWLVGMLVVAHIVIPEPKRRPSFEEDARAVAVASTHIVSYFGSVAMTLVVALKLWLYRRRTGAGAAG